MELVNASAFRCLGCSQHTQGDVSAACWDWVRLDENETAAKCGAHVRTPRHKASLFHPLFHRHERGQERRPIHSDTMLSFPLSKWAVLMDNLSLMRHHSFHWNSLYHVWGIRPGRGDVGSFNSDIKFFISKHFALCLLLFYCFIFWNLECNCMIFSPLSSFEILLYPSSPLLKS